MKSVLAQIFRSARVFFKNGFLNHQELTRSLEAVTWHNNHLAVN